MRGRGWRPTDPGCDKVLPGRVCFRAPRRRQRKDMAGKSGLHKEHLVFHFVHQTFSTDHPEIWPEPLRSYAGLSWRLWQVRIGISWIILLHVRKTTNTMTVLKCSVNCISYLGGIYFSFVVFECFVLNEINHNEFAFYTWAVLQNIYLLKLKVKLDGDKVVRLTHRPPLPQEIHLYSFLFLG